MSTAALWIGWAVIGAGAVVAAFAVVVFVPYLVLDQLWQRVKLERDFIVIARRYFAERDK